MWLVTHRHAAEKKQPFSRERKWTLLSLVMVFQTPVEDFSASGTHSALPEWFGPWTERIKRCIGWPCAAVTIGRRDDVTMYSFCFEIKVVNLLYFKWFWYVFCYLWFSSPMSRNDFSPGTLHHCLLWCVHAKTWAQCETTTVYIILYLSVILFVT